MVTKHGASPWRKRLSRLAWVALEGVVGAGIGLMAITLYLAAR